jgi:hypothetical protein
MHRQHGPSVLFIRRALMHREHGPSVLFVSGALLHRQHGPSVLYVSGALMHRQHGPSVLFWSSDAPTAWAVRALVPHDGLCLWSLLLVSVVVSPLVAALCRWSPLSLSVVGFCVGLCIESLS